MTGAAAIFAVMIKKGVEFGANCGFESRLLTLTMTKHGLTSYYCYVQTSYLFLLPFAAWLKTLLV